MRISGNNYTTRTHDSLKISNGKWMWWSQRIGGYNALDYLVKVKGISFVEAVETLVGKAAVMPTLTVRPKQEEKPKVLLLPEKSKTTNKIRDYLFNRGIDEAITEECIEKGIVFESLPYHNLVFVGFDNEQKLKYASYRSTGNRRILGDCSGSDKHYSFRLADSKSKEVHLFECAIDLLSYATLAKLSGKDWREENLVSLAGVYLPKEKIEDSTTPAAVVKYLADRPDIQKIHTSEYERFAYYAMKYPNYYYAFEVLYWCGLREGEMLALTLQDIDLEQAVIYVNKTYQRFHRQDIISTPKTPSSVRKVSMPAFLCDELKEYIDMLYSPAPDQRIFTITKSKLTHRFHKLSEEAGLRRITVHGLRHSHVSLLISKKYDIFEVSKRIGHKSIKTTQDIYGHLFDEVQKTIANDLDSLRRR